MSELNNKNIIQLTPEQQARIAENKRLALERLNKLRQANLSNKNVAQVHVNNNSSPKILPSKGNNSSSRFNPYNLKPQNSNSIIKQNQTSSTSKVVKCKFEIQNNERFVVKTDAYSQEIINEYQKLSSKSYNAETRNWSFHMKDYDQLIKNLESLKSSATLEKIPEFVIRQISRHYEEVDETNVLNNISTLLVSSLLDFQKLGICFGISREGRCLIADDMGLGKTRQALGIADFYRDDWPLLIVTNASTREFWESEINKLLSDIAFCDVHIIQRSRNYFENAKIVIASYAALDNNINELQEKKFGIVIFDESHNLKNPKAKQTMNAKVISKSARRLIMITGTPALSRPVELFPQIEMLEKTSPTFYQFAARYCNGRQSPFGYDASGSSNLEELNILLRKTIMIRRVKGDVCFELGNKSRFLVQLQNIDVKPEENEEMEQFFQQYQNGNAENKQSEEILLQWYQSTAKVKARACCMYLEQFLQKSDEKILVFAHHQVMINTLCGYMEIMKMPYIRIDGSTRSDLRSERVECFQHDPRIRVAILSIRSCGAGITLTAASVVIFCEFDWNPSSIIQAEARAHRIGQEREVKVYFLLAPKTADDFIWKLLQQKQTQLGKAGLVANIEKLSDNAKLETFNVQEAVEKNESFSTESEVYYSCDTSAQFDESNCINLLCDNSKNFVEPQKPNNYFEDDDDDFLDEEVLNLMENKPK